MAEPNLFNNYIPRTYGFEPNYNGDILQDVNVNTDRAQNVVRKTANFLARRIEAADKWMQYQQIKEDKRAVKEGRAPDDMTANPLAARKYNFIKTYGTTKPSRGKVFATKRNTLNEIKKLRVARTLANADVPIALQQELRRNLNRAITDINNMEVVKERQEDKKLFYENQAIENSRRFQYATPNWRYPSWEDFRSKKVWPKARRAAPYQRALRVIPNWRVSQFTDPAVREDRTFNAL